MPHNARNAISRSPAPKTSLSQNHKQIHPILQHLTPYRVQIEAPALSRADIYKFAKLNTIPRHTIRENSAGGILETSPALSGLTLGSTMARVYADVNQKMPRSYWDYDSVNISWGILENYEVVRKIGILVTNITGLTRQWEADYAQVAANTPKSSKASTL